MNVLKSLGSLLHADFAALDELADAVPVGILTARCDLILIFVFSGSLWILAVCCPNF